LAVIGVLLICLSLTALGGFAYFKFSRPQKPIPDRVSLCPITGPEGVTVVLVDTTDNLPETTKREVRQFLNDLIIELPAYYKLDIRVLDAASAKSKSLFSRCNPGDGVGLSEWTDNPAIARKRWIEGFQKPAEEAMGFSLRFDRAAASPIMAAIQDIAIDQFSAANVRNAPKSLIIISDMIEHTRDYSQYSGDLTFERYKRSPAYLKYRTDLHGAKVAIGYVRRLGAKLDTKRHPVFWQEWVVDNRGTVDRIRSLQGAE
jgi:hypothetical protein